jgi:hypothetical protein
MRASARGRTLVAGVDGDHLDVGAASLVVKMTFTKPTGSRVVPA